MWQANKVAYRGNDAFIRAYKGDELVWKKSRLPIGYQEVEYLQSTGMQYIDLGITADANSMEWMHKVRMPSSASNNVTFGSGESSKYLYALYLYTRGLIGNIGTSYNPTYDVSPALYLNKDVTEHVTMSNGAYTGVVECDGNTITKTVTYSTSAIPTTNGMYMFCTHHRDGLAKYNLNGRYYYLKIWKSNVLTLDLIPAKRTSDNTLGMYDLVSNTFFTNKGTGTFIAGPDVN